jgi:hypothetical protein
LSILSRKVLQSAVASGTSNPQLGGEMPRVRILNLQMENTTFLVILESDGDWCEK